MKELAIINIKQEEKNFVVDVLRSMDEIKEIPSFLFCHYKTLALYVDKEGRVTYSGMSFFDDRAKREIDWIKEIIDYKEFLAGIAQ